MALFVALAGILFVGCSKDDDTKCESCTLQGEKIEICDKKNGTYQLKVAGETETVTEEQLGGLTPKQFVESACALDIGF